MIRSRHGQMKMKDVFVVNFPPESYKEVMRKLEDMDYKLLTGLN